jgi:hypothetical protein
MNRMISLRASEEVDIYPCLVIMIASGERLAIFWANSTLSEMTDSGVFEILLIRWKFNAYIVSPWAARNYTE